MEVITCIRLQGCKQFFLLNKINLYVLFVGRRVPWVYEGLQYSSLWVFPKIWIVL